MRSFYVTLIACIGLLAIPSPANAQAAAKAGKAVISLIKGGKKAATKTVKFKPKSSTSSTSNSRAARSAYLRSRYTDCSACNGEGKVKVWNSYYNCYFTQNCVRCGGTGKTKRY